MQGFFTSKQTQVSNRSVSGKTYSCVSCGLYKNAQHPKMEAFGNFNKGILNIGEFPEGVDDQRGQPWQGKAGRELARTYKKIGIDLFEDCLNINAVNCHSPKGRSPIPFQIECCNYVKVMPIIQKYKPKVIVLFGKSAIESIIGGRWKLNLGGVDKWRGFAIPDRELNCWIIPTFNPSYILQQEAKEVETIWKQDLKLVLKKSREKLPVLITPKIKIIRDLKELYKLPKTGTVAFDYETTGLKPHDKGHRIVCGSMSAGEVTMAFRMPNTQYDRKPLLDILSSYDIGKQAHNMKFEDIWTWVRLRTKVNKWEWDSMLAAHILDNRKGITSLKFQTYVNFGIVDYSSEVNPYLRSKDSKNANGKNTVEDLISFSTGEELLLNYCGEDSHWEYQLAQTQQDQIGWDNLPF